ncbi:hypothetical protein [Pseudalkalibacillus decolorationis]|uniref:hypothetical protein n=1 Tax=Pseudalkalibacillus decolorationis TaxID=163879 RepID=UPI002147A88F|nr:hypothetical protein [Pseudalkalibacillus decolorationis]
MTFAVALMLIVTFNLLLYLFSFILNKKTEVSTMEVMTIAMSIGMTVGLVSGCYFGFIIENLFLSTLISMAFGGIVGFILGLPCSIIASIDGLLSGVMGGMMGAMLGAMLSYEDWNEMLKFLFLLQTVVIVVLVWYLNKRYRPVASTISPYKWLLCVLLVFSGIMYTIYASNLTYIPNDKNDTNHESHP